MADPSQPQTPPRRTTRSSAPSARPPPTPELTRRIEENRLKAKGLRDQYEQSRRQDGPTRTPSGFVAGPDARGKRTHDAISTSTSTTASAYASAMPGTARDARGPAAGLSPGGRIEAARKFKRFVDHDFSKMTDTKGGFLSVEDDPFNKAFQGGGGEKGDQGRPEHMSLKEWERLRLMRELRRRKEGPFEPGLSVLAGEERRKRCRECGSAEIDWVWEEVFETRVCGGCKEKFPEKYSLLTKTEVKDDYLLTDPELKDPELLPHLSKPNPHKSHWHDMMLFLRYQVEEYALGPKKWGSAEALDAEFAKRESDKKRRKEDKFRAKLDDLKKKTRAEHYRRAARGGGAAGFGDRIAGGRHEHEWGRTVENAEGVTVKTCVECGMEVEELEF